MSTPTRPSVSIVIPAFNAQHVLPRQLEALLPQLQDGDEIIVADNRSTDGTAQLLQRLAREHRSLRSVPAAQRQGVNHARNCGLLASSGQLVLICDADDRVHPGWVQAMVEALAKAPLVGGRSLPVDDDGQPLGLALGLSSVLGGPDYPLGANLGMRRVVAETTGGFDEAFARGHDETDLAWRAQAAGFALTEAPEAVIDYTQRRAPRSRARQARGSGRTSILLWTRHEHLLPPHAVNMRAAVRSLLRSLPLGLRLLLHRVVLEEAAEWGWCVGVLEGHVRYRLLRRIPAPIIPVIPPISAPGPRAGSD